MVFCAPFFVEVIYNKSWKGADWWAGRRRVLVWWWLPHSAHSVTQQYLMRTHAVLGYLLATELPAETAVPDLT